MIDLPEAVEVYFHAVNDGRSEAFLAAFDAHASVLDHQREFKGIEAVRDWSDAEVFRPKVRFVIDDAAEQGGAYVVIASVDGEFDKTNLPDPLLLKHVFKLMDGKINELYITFP